MVTLSPSSGSIVPIIEAAVRVLPSAAVAVGEVLCAEIMALTISFEFITKILAEPSYNADVLIVGGTSLTVHPASSLVDAFEGEHLIIINRTPTPYDGYAEFVIRESIADVLSSLVNE